MQSSMLSSLIPALVVIGLVVLLEDLAFMKARTKYQRALIMGVAVFVLVLMFSSPLAVL